MYNKIIYGGATVGMLMGFTLGGLLTLTGGIFTFFCITQFSIFWSHNLGWLVIILLITGIAAIVGGAYLLYNLARKQ
jgi:hypothetical protein